MGHQADQGFAHVPEGALDQAHDHLKIPKPSEEKGQDRKQELALSLMKELRKTWSTVDAMKALNKAHVMEHPEGEMDLKLIPKDCLMQLVKHNEAQEIDKDYARARQEQKSETDVVQQRHERAQAYFRCPRGAKKSTGAKPPRFAAPKNPKAPKATEFLMKNVPSTIVVEQDDYNARWRIICESGEWKSISWTTRGIDNGTALSLYHAWRLHRKHTGEEPGFDIEELNRA